MRVVSCPCSVFWSVSVRPSSKYSSVSVRPSKKSSVSVRPSEKVPVRVRPSDQNTEHGRETTSMLSTVLKVLFSELSVLITNKTLV